MTTGFNWPPNLLATITAMSNQDNQVYTAVLSSNMVNFCTQLGGSSDHRRTWIRGPTITPIYTPISHKKAIWKGTNPILRGLSITMLINHLLNGMTLQAIWKICTWSISPRIRVAKIQWIIENTAWMNINTLKMLNSRNVRLPTVNTLFRLFWITLSRPQYVTLTQFFPWNLKIPCGCHFQVKHVRRVVGSIYLPPPPNI